MVIGRRLKSIPGQDSRFHSLRSRDIQLIANLPREGLSNFTMSRHRGASSIHRIAIHGMIPALTCHFATILLQVPNKIVSFHVAGTSTVRVSQTASRGASKATSSR